MNTEQFRRWQTFAIRMAHRGWPRLPRKSRKKTAGMVKDFFRRLYGFDCDGTLVERIENWDHTADCKHGRCYDLVCDAVTMMIDDWNPYDEDSCEGKQWEARWGVRVRCCLRAGLDMAVGDDGGVLGFDVCDLRRMYRGSVPTWVNDGRWLAPDGDEPVNLNQGRCDVGIFL